MSFVTFLTVTIGSRIASSQDCFFFFWCPNFPLKVISSNECWLQSETYISYFCCLFLLSYLVFASDSFRAILSSWVFSFLTFLKLWSLVHSYAEIFFFFKPKVLFCTCNIHYILPSILHLLREEDVSHKTPVPSPAGDFLQVPGTGGVPCARALLQRGLGSERLATALLSREEWQREMVLRRQPAVTVTGRIPSRGAQTSVTSTGPFTFYSLESRDHFRSLFSCDVLDMSESGCRILPGFCLLVEYLQALLASGPVASTESFPAWHESSHSLAVLALIRAGSPGATPARQPPAASVPNPFHCFHLASVPGHLGAHLTAAAASCRPWTRPSVLCP